jgi:translation elongation factor EF-Tu-like GTPase
MNPEHREFELLGKVETVFSIPGRGTVIVPIWQSDLKVKVRDVIQLRITNGQIRNTRIIAVELLKTEEGSRAGFMLPNDVPKNEVAEGAEIWLALKDDVVAPTSR